MPNEESPDNNEHPALGIQGIPQGKLAVMDSVTENNRPVAMRGKGENAR